MEANELLEISRSELLRSNADRRHPFRLCVLSTINKNYPESRWVVKRKADKSLSLLIYTDTRSPKVEQLNVNPLCTVLFYHPKRKLQLRFKGAMQVLNEGETFDHHHEIAKQYPTDYTTPLAPGLPLQSDLMQLNDVQFSLLKFKPSFLDALLLRNEGHLRYAYHLKNEQWVGSAITP